MAFTSTVEPSRLARRALLVAGGAALLATSHAALAWGQRVSGSGKPATEKRDASGYSGVSVTGSFKVVLRASGREGVELRGDDNLLPLVETRVVDGRDGRTLELRWRDGVTASSQERVVATIDVAQLSRIALAGNAELKGEGLVVPSLAVSIAGSGEAALTQLGTDELALSVAGSGTLRTAGRSGKLAVAISGSGDVDTDALEADEVRVRVAGSGDAAVQARKTLDVSIAGSGDVIYRGEAKVHSSIAGSGSVRRR